MNFWIMATSTMMKAAPRQAKYSRYQILAGPPVARSRLRTSARGPMMKRTTRVTVIENSENNTKVPILFLRHSPEPPLTLPICERRTVLKKNGLLSYVGATLVSNDAHTAAGFDASIIRVKTLGGRVSGL